MDLKTALFDLESKNYFVWDDFLSKTEVESVLLDSQTLYGLGSFRKAGTGTEVLTRNADGKVRSDETCWLDPLALTLSQSLFWERLENLKLELNAHFYLGLWSLDGHYSRYPVAGKYRKHLDRFSSDDQRTISMVIYLNSNWATGDGGELRLHLNESDRSTLDLAPIGGRLVCFMSATMLHEVLVSHQVRQSFAGWWKRRGGILTF